MESILGAELLTKEGMKPTAEVLAGKTLVAFYFSAHWCPPCRGFTPVLSQLYSEYIDGGSSVSKDMVIIFVSSDRDEGACQDYYKDMPWACLPFANRGAKAALAEKYSVSGIPMLVVCKPDGEVVVANARGEAQNSQDLGKLVETWAK
jgi:nucleoredoxin